MCGFVAVIGQCDAERLREMGKLIEHRGPDEQSEWTDGAVTVVFRRLSVVDPSGSHQPLRNEDGTVLVWFNGEIYNHRVLRDMLQQAGHILLEEGDGEVIAHLYEEYGEQFLHYLEGMFAIVVYDQRLQRCFVGRDRYGIKPLFFRRDDMRTVFASAIAPLLSLGETQVLNRAALGAYLRYRYVPSDEHQLTHGILKVPAGSLCVVDIEAAPRQPIDTRAYYADKGHLEASTWRRPSRKAWQDSLLRVRQSLTAAVERHLMADVPLGVFLSGGVDSAITLGLMRQAVGPSVPIHTFTASFLEGESEGERARQVSDFHHTLHHELPISKSQFFETVDKATRHWGGPVSEPAAIPTLLLSQFAKQYVTVVLTGEGADELFVGYPKYELENLLGKLPLLQHLPSWLIPARSRRFGRLRDALQTPRVQERNVTWFGAFSDDAIDRLLGVGTDSWADMGSSTGACPSVEIYRVFANQINGKDRGTLSSLLKFDRETWLTHNLLHKFDAMTMAGSLEARVPFLDSQVVQAALDIPVQWHLRYGLKSVLKEAFTDLVPPGYFASPKNGFRVPVAKWLGELNLESVLGRGTLVEDGVLRADEVDRFVAAFRKNPAYHDRRLWTLWAVEVWYHMTFAASKNLSTSLSSVGGA